jgi:hypothetical protein
VGRENVDQTVLNAGLGYCFLHRVGQVNEVYLALCRENAAHVENFEAGHPIYQRLTIVCGGSNIFLPKNAVANPAHS